MRERPGQKPHEMTEELKRIAYEGGKYGIPRKQIAAQMGIGEATLFKYYKDIMNKGDAEANGEVAKSLFRRATSNGPDATTAAIFWCKTRMGWKDTMNVSMELSGPDGALLALSIDAPPAETREQWLARKAKELSIVEAEFTVSPDEEEIDVSPHAR